MVDLKIDFVTNDDIVDDSDSQNALNLYQF